MALMGDKIADYDADTRHNLLKLLPALSWEWFSMFPASSLSTDPRSAIRRRHHLHKANINP